MPLQIHKACILGSKRVLKKMMNSTTLESLEVKDERGRTPLMYCVMHDHVECASLLLKTGVHVDNSDSLGRTALHIAANKGFHKCIKLLLLHKASCRQNDFYGVSPLHLAAIHSNHKSLSAILKLIKPIEIDIQDSSKKTALHWSCAHSNLDSIKLLLKSGANISIPDEEGKTPLHWAVMNDNPQALECVKVLLAKGINLVNWQDYEGRSALHLAVATGSSDVVRYLACRDDCNIDILDHAFCTPLHWAAKKGLRDKADILLNRKASHASADYTCATPLHYAAYYNQSKTVATFLSRNYVSDIGDSMGRNSFMWAAARNAVDVLRVMDEISIDLNYTTDYDGMNALHVAARQGQVSAVEFLLLKWKAHINVKDKYGMSPLLRACETGRTGTSQTLLSHGADLHIRDVNSSTVLHWCALGGHAYLCQILIQKGAHCDIQDDFGMTPLHYACMKEGSLNCVSILLESDSNPNIVDMEGKTPLHWAILSSGNRNIVKLLCCYDANANMIVHDLTNKCWTTPLDMAISKGYTEISEILKKHGGLKMKQVREIAASKIQLWFISSRIGRTNTHSHYKDTYSNSSLGANLSFLKQCKDVVDVYQMLPLKYEHEISFSTVKADISLNKFDFYQDTVNLENIIKSYEYPTGISQKFVEITSALIIQRFFRKCAIKRKFQRLRENAKNALTNQQRVNAEQSWQLKMLSFCNQT